MYSTDLWFGCAHTLPEKSSLYGGPALTCSEDLASWTCPALIWSCLMLVEQWLDWSAIFVLDLGWLAVFRSNCNAPISIKVHQTSQPRAYWRSIRFFLSCLASQFSTFQYLIACYALPRGRRDNGGELLPRDGPRGLRDI